VSILLLLLIGVIGDGFVVWAVGVGVLMQVGNLVSLQYKISRS